MSDQDKSRPLTEQDLLDAGFEELINKGVYWHQGVKVIDTPLGHRFYRPELFYRDGYWAASLGALRWKLRTRADFETWIGTTILHFCDIVSDTPKGDKLLNFLIPIHNLNNV